MPEGDTLWRAARTLHDALAGRLITGFATPLAGVALLARQFRLIGRSVDRVEARGKHLFIRFSGPSGLSLHTHMRMTGSWHLYKRTSSWRKPRHLARVVLEAGDRVAVCFQAPVVELLGSREEKAHPALSALGPDVLAPNFDLDEACRRLRLDPAREIGHALLDQGALAGIGNVYKSEALFARRLNPRTLVGALDDAALRALVRTASQQMRRTLDSPHRRTTATLAEEDLYVYGRAGRPCLRCRSGITRIYQGRPSRSTYFCPVCQPPTP